MCVLILLLASTLALGGEVPTVVATTPIVADVVQAVAEELVPVVSLIPMGTDPHAFEPTPKDLQLLLSAALIFANGAGLEEFLEPLLALPEIRPKVVDLSAGLPLRYIDSEPDGHVWLDPLHVLAWVEKIERALGALFPEERSLLAARAEAYRQALRELDRWIREEVEKIPPERRLLVSDHFNLGYFAARYGFTEVGAILPGVTTLAEPSAREVAQLVEKIRALGIPAIFIGIDLDRSLAERVAHESGARVVELFLGTLSEPGGPAPNYLALMRENVRRIVAALGG